MSDQIYNVLFLCTSNSARSQMAEAILNKEGKGRFKAYSAGSHPGEGPHPFAMDLLKQSGFDVSNCRSKSWDEFAQADAPVLDFVFTVCDDAANETCPIWPGQPLTAHWGIPDPAKATGTDAEKRFAFAEAYRMLEARISLLLNLPIAAIDRLALHKKLTEIGKTKAGAA